MTPVCCRFARSWRRLNFREFERRADAQLARSYVRQLWSDVLLAPIHGSRSSSSEAFYKRVELEFIVFSAGYRNSFGHPHERVVVDCGEFASKVLNTVEVGMVNFGFNEKFSDQGAQEDKIFLISECRKLNSRYWH